MNFFAPKLLKTLTVYIGEVDLDDCETCFVHYQKENNFGGLLYSALQVMPFKEAWLISFSIINGFEVKDLNLYTVLLPKGTGARAVSDKSILKNLSTSEFYKLTAIAVYRYHENNKDKDFIRYCHPESQGIYDGLLEFGKLLNDVPSDLAKAYKSIEPALIARDPNPGGEFTMNFNINWKDNEADPEPLNYKSHVSNLEAVSDFLKTKVDKPASFNFLFNFENEAIRDMLTKLSNTLGYDMPTVDIKNYGPTTVVIWTLDTNRDFMITFGA